MQRYEYKFVRVLGNRGLLSPVADLTEDYQSEIRKQAEEGRRFVQILAPLRRALGPSLGVDSIFEREFPDRQDP